MTPILFLDIDGVLNTHRLHAESMSTGLQKHKVERLNKILRVTGARIVLSSAWRYIILAGSMNLCGFSYMLRTHGVAAMDGVLLGTTRLDEHCPCCGYEHQKIAGIYECLWSARYFRVCVKCGEESTRGRQITAWLKEHGKPEKYAVVDDLDLGIRAEGHPFVQTRKRVGLTENDCWDVIRLLVKHDIPGR